MPAARADGSTPGPGSATAAAAAASPSATPTRARPRAGLGLPPVAVETASGIAAGLLSTLFVHPLDLIKTRLQIDRSARAPRLGSSLRIARLVYAHEGGLTGGLYRGLTPNLLGNMASWGLYFMLYGELKARTRAHTAADFLLSSAAAGCITAVATNPLWVVKTRMLATAASTPGAYPSFSAGVAAILRAEGVGGLFRGLVPALAGVSHGALQFMFYEELKKWRAGAERPVRAPSSPSSSSSSSVRAGAENRDAGESGKRGDGGGGGGGGGAGAEGASARVGRGEHGLSNADFLLLSGTAKVLAGSITYPYRVVQTRMQNHEGEGLARVVGGLWRVEGLRGFYKGLAPNLLRVLPSTCITFLVYENARRVLG